MRTVGSGFERGGFPVEGVRGGEDALGRTREGSVRVGVGEREWREKDTNAGTVDMELGRRTGHFLICGARETRRDQPRRSSQPQTREKSESETVDSPFPYYPQSEPTPPPRPLCTSLPRTVDTAERNRTSPARGLPLWFSHRGRPCGSGAS